MVTGTLFKNHLFEVGLTQNRETVALQMLTTVDLFLGSHNIMVTTLDQCLGRTGI
jgi:hypothetical protein